MDAQEADRPAGIARIERYSRWTTPLFCVHNPDHDALQAPLVACLREAAARDDDRSDVAPLAKAGLVESRFDLFRRELEPVLELRSFCSAALLEVVGLLNRDVWPESLDPRVRYVESWFHVTRDGGYHDAHTHSMCSWCGIYYVDVGDASARPVNGVNRFYDPRPGIEPFDDWGTRYHRQELALDVPPENGALILFPAYLRHAALPYRGSRERIVVAFNATIVSA